VGEEAATAEAQTIRPDAELLFVAGAGWTKKQADGQSHLPEAEQLILGFLEGSQASLGSSKSLVDQSGEGQAVLSFMSHMNQVGQTGSTPRHPKGLATCCHGEEPHVVGWRFIKERRAVIRGDGQSERASEQLSAVGGHPPIVGRRGGLSSGAGVSDHAITAQP
jgi:electron transfer flavoprotein alpha subunit